MKKITVALLVTGLVLSGCSFSFHKYPRPHRAHNAHAGSGYCAGMLAALEAGELINDGVEWDYVSEGDGYSQAQEVAENADKYDGCLALLDARRENHVGDGYEDGQDAGGTEAPYHRDNASETDEDEIG